MKLNLYSRLATLYSLEQNGLTSTSTRHDRGWCTGKGAEKVRK